jgi:hypothetical protein
LDYTLDMKAIQVKREESAHEVPLIPEVNEKPEDGRLRLH